MRLTDLLLFASLAYGQTDAGDGCAAPAVSCTVLTYSTTGDYVWSPETGLGTPTPTQNLPPALATTVQFTTLFIPTNLPTVTQCAACSGTTVYAWQNSFHGMPWPKAIPAWIAESIDISINITSYQYGGGPSNPNGGWSWQNNTAPANMSGLPSWVWNPAAADNCDYGYYLPYPSGNGWAYATNSPPAMSGATTTSSDSGSSMTPTTTTTFSSFSFINDPNGNSIVSTGTVTNTFATTLVTQIVVTAPVMATTSASTASTSIPTTSVSILSDPGYIPPPPFDQSTTSASTAMNPVITNSSSFNAVIGPVTTQATITTSVVVTQATTFSSFSTSTSAPTCTPVASQYAPGQSCNCNYAIETCSEIIPRSTETVYVVPAGQATTLDECIAVCDNELDCVSLSWQISTQTCSLYDDSNTATDPNSTILANPDFVLANVISTQCPNSDCSQHDF